MTYIASLAMYDGGELTAANDALWGSIAARLHDFGVDAPARLERVSQPPDVWLDERLLFGHACGYPFAARLASTLRLVGTPDYDVPGAELGRHRSFIVVAARSTARSLGDLGGARVVINDVESMTGRHLLGDVLADLAPSFASVTVSGSHARSLALVAEGRADVAAIDCVSYFHLARSSPEIVAETRTIGETRTTPCLPFVVATACGEVTASFVRRAVREAFADPRTKDARSVLRLGGLIAPRAASYDLALEIAAQADRVFPQSVY